MTLDDQSTSAVPERCLTCGYPIVVSCTYLHVAGRGSYHWGACAEHAGYAVVNANGELSRESKDG